MRKRTSFAAIVTVALFFVCLSFGTSVAQLFNYTPYPFLSIDQENYYGSSDPFTDGTYLVPNYLPGGERYFLVPVFIGNFTDPLKNPNTKDGTWKTDDQRIFGVDGQFLVPIRNFEFQIQYPNQAIEIDDNPAHGSPIVTVGPDQTLAMAQTLAAPFYMHYTDQSANDPTNPFSRIIRITGASEVPLPLTKLNQTPPAPVYNDTDAVLLYVRFHVIQNWTVNSTILRLDSAKFGDHIGDPQYSPANYRRGNLAGHKAFERGILPLRITDLPQFEIRPFVAINTTDNKNFDLLTPLIYDPTDPTLQNPIINLQIRDAVASTRLLNVNICTDQDWLKIGFTGTEKQHCLYTQKIDYPGVISSDEKNLFISADVSGLAPGVYYGYITLTADGAGNSPARIKVQLVVRANPDEPTAGGGTGIHVTLTNSCSPTCSKTLVFGTGHGATSGIDLLYGETVFSQTDKTDANNNVDISKRCYGYFEPLDVNADPEFQDPDFLGTLRDIRSNTGDTTLLYKVDFGAGGPVCYPISVCMDPSDFPEGSRIIVRDVTNGSIFSFNMREGTPVGGSRCVYIRDPNITSFIIEYTPGSKGLTADIVPQTWNFLSLPVIPPNPSSAVIWPNSTSTPFGYSSNAGWAPAANLEFGRGYMGHWGTVIGNDNIVSGVRSSKLSNVRMHGGWNAVGGVSIPVCSDINLGVLFLTPVGGTNPHFETRCWEFIPREGYNQVNYLIPGHGYFVKISDEANYNIDPSLVNVTCKNSVDAIASLKSELGKVTVRDAAQNAQPLFFGDASTTMSASSFEMPPSFTDFDARFASNNGNISTNATQHVVKITSNNYPVTLQFEGAGGTVEVRDVTGKTIGSVTNNGTVVIPDASIKQVVLAMKGSASETVNGFSLEASYPNPVGGVSSFTYSVPSETFVTITLTNALGQEMAKLVNTTVAAGAHSVKIDGSDLTDGTYFYTIHAGNFTKTEKITVTH